MIKASDIVKYAPKYMGTPYERLDCQAFVEACLKDAGRRINLAGSNAWFRECMKHGWTGTPEECKRKYGKIPPGAFLFILSDNGKEPEQYKRDGIGNASHIGIYTGETGQEMVEQAKSYGVQKANQYDFGNGAMHSSASRGCVCTSKFAGKTISGGGWNRVGLWDEVDYGGNDATPEIGTDETAVVYSDNGKPVKMRAEPSTACPVYREVPSGATVIVLDHGTDWAHIRWDSFKGYMLTRFLLFDGATPPVFTVTIPHLSKSQADALISQYPGSTISEERG